MIQRPDILTEEQMGDFIQNAPWKFATSYKDTFPHVYTTRGRVQDDHLFNSFVYTMRERSIIKAFFSNQYLYYEHGENEYWEMGRPVFCVEVINRAPIWDCATYRHRTPKNGDREVLLSKLKQRDEYLFGLLNKKELTAEEKASLDFLMDSERGSPNRMQHSSSPVKYHK